MAKKGSTAHLIELDLGLAGSMEGGHWRCRDTDAYIRLEELYPGDPGEASGAQLRILDAGRYLTLAVLAGDHWVGHLPVGKLAALVAVLREQPKKDVEMFLFESDPEQSGYPFSGAKLVYTDHTLGLYFGHHCLGIVRGALLNRFLECATYRCCTAQRA
jgi:hypothetical protein